MLPCETNRPNLGASQFSIAGGIHRQEVCQNGHQVDMDALFALCKKHGTALPTYVIPSLQW
jgi:hypothetical protein